MQIQQANSPNFKGLQIKGRHTPINRHAQIPLDIAEQKKAAASLQKTPNILGDLSDEFLGRGVKRAPEKPAPIAKNLTAEAPSGDFLLWF